MSLNQAFPLDFPVARRGTIPETSPGSSVRHSRLSTQILQSWFDAHAEHPYPSECEKTVLQDSTGLTARQLNHWFANSRRRRQPKRARSTGCMKQSGSTSSLLTADLDRDLFADQQSPLERWRNSPPEEEPADLEAIAAATGCNAAQHLSRSQPRPQAFDTFGKGKGLPGRHRAPSTASWGWSDGTSLSSLQTSSAESSGSSQALASAEKSVNSPRRRQIRKSKQTNASSSQSRKRPYQCTFCTDAFLTKYDWTRHEAALHLNLELWTCMPFGPIGFDTATGTPQCSFCMERCPTRSHLDTHRINDCKSGPDAQRTFLRKDHLRQHLRHVHGVSDIQPLMSTWQRKRDLIRSRCGLCAQQFTRWSVRNEHLAAHFKAGATMKEWKGDRGLEPSVQFHVQNAMPPYLIAAEAGEFEPFSASRKSTTTPAISTTNTTRAPTAFEALTMQLAEYVRAALRTGELVNDETVRKQARLFMYGDDDAWNQTPADNADWLRLFKDGLNLNAPADAIQGGLCDNGTGLTGGVMSRNPASPVQIEGGGTLYEFFEGSTGTQCQLPLAWQTPECLAEFRQMAHQQSLAQSHVCPLVSEHNVASDGMPSLEWPIDHFLEPFDFAEHEMPLIEFSAAQGREDEIETSEHLRDSGFSDLGRS